VPPPGSRGLECTGDDGETPGFVIADEDPRRLFQAAREAAAPIRHLRRQQPVLDGVFAHITGGD